MERSVGDSAPVLKRFTTGITGIDTITRGGLFQAGLYIVTGRPGSGKTTAANQICYHHARQGGRAVYVTLLAETHGRMLTQMHAMSFYDPSVVGAAVTYTNGFTALESEGLEGLLRLLRSAVREQKASLLVLDGIVTASALARSSIDYKKFINELQAWVSVIGCTVLFLTSGTAGAASEPEYTMVDGIIELRTRRSGLLRMRELYVRKFRGSGFLEGGHPYKISDDGLIVYPRVEAQLDTYPIREPLHGWARSGVDGLDSLLGGGYPIGSTTALVGPSGTGKTTLGLQFLTAGANAQEPGLFFGFYEPPPELIEKAEALGIPSRAVVSQGLLRILWQPPAEHILDALVYDLLLTVRRHGIKRLFVDGLLGFKSSTYPERLPGLFSVLNQELRALGVTTVYTEEGTRVTLPGTASSVASGLFDNVVRLRRSPRIAAAGLLCVQKARRSPHLRAWSPYVFGAGGLSVQQLLSPSDGTQIRAGT